MDLDNQGSRGEPRRLISGKTIELPEAPKSATFFGACDNVMTLFVNGEMVTQHTGWESPTRENLTKRLKAGKNVIADPRQQPGQPGRVHCPDQHRASRRQQAGDRDRRRRGWPPPIPRATGRRPTSTMPPGPSRTASASWASRPWGNVALTSATGSGSQATPVEAIKALPGFQGRAALLRAEGDRRDLGRHDLRPQGPADRLATSTAALYRVTPGKDAGIDQGREARRRHRRGPGTALRVRALVRRRQRRQGPRQRPVSRSATPTATTSSTRSSC